MYRTLLDNGTCRIVKVDQKPGEQDRWHSHPDAAIYHLSASEIMLYTPDGDPQIIKSETGDSYFAPMTNMHSMKNIGESNFVGIFCELKTESPGNPHSENVYTAPTDLISLKSNNDRIHVLELTLQSGAVEQLAANSKKAIYYITDASVNLVSENGVSESSVRPQGASSYHSPGAVQSIENLGAETVRAVIFEMR
jgi:quercetin dioxygenase-like cupin family protein